MNPLSIVLILALPYVMEYERLVAEKKNNPNLCSANNKLTKIININHSDDKFNSIR
jgi:hypothetical protein